jgi:hypothetical protein
MEEVYKDEESLQETKAERSRKDDEGHSLLWGQVNHEIIQLPQVLDSQVQITA